MEPEDWEAAAGDYGSEVLSVFDHDRAGKVGALIESSGGADRVATDLGCGVGPFLPLLCKHFGHVLACDYSTAMLDEARRTAAGRDNLEFARVDLREGPPGRPADFVLCVNALLSPTLAEREKMWRHLARAALPGGRVAVVAPSLESGLLARHRLVEWNLRSGIAPGRALRASFGDEDPDAVSIARGGLLDAGGMHTKHYLEEELATTGARFGLAIGRCEKIEYPWRTEFHKPPRWMRGPYPWDWLAVFDRV